MRAVNAHPMEGALVVRYALLIPRLLHLLLSAPNYEFLLNRDSLSALGVPIARISVIDKHLISYATILLMIEDTAPTATAPHLYSTHKSLRRVPGAPTPTGTGLSPV